MPPQNDDLRTRPDCPGIDATVEAALDERGPGTHTHWTMTHHAMLFGLSLLALAGPVPAHATSLGDAVVPACSGDGTEKGDEKSSLAPYCECDDGKGEKK